MMAASCALKACWGLLAGWLASTAVSAASIIEIPSGWEEPAALQGLSMNKRCRKEVIELHQFFEDWFAGRLENSDQGFQRFSGVLSEGFQIVGPGGTLTPRSRLLDGLRRSHASMKGKKFRIWIEGYQGRPIGDGLWLITYQEWQEDGKGRKGRLSSAVFRAKPGNPNQVEWLHVHEVWLPRGE